MFAIAFLFVRVLCDCFKSRRRLEAEILVLRHQLNVLQQRAPRRLYLTWADRALFVWLSGNHRRAPQLVRILAPQPPSPISHLLSDVAQESARLRAISGV